MKGGLFWASNWLCDGGTKLNFKGGSYTQRQRTLSDEIWPNGYVHRGRERA